MNKKSCGWKIFFEVIFCSPKDSQLLAPWPSVKCISYIGKNPLQTKIKYVKNLEHVQFFVGRGQVDLARNNLSALWVGNCNCFILVFIMNMHPLLLLDNSQRKGSGRPLAKKFGYRDGSGRVVRKFWRQKAHIWEINVRQIIINSRTPKIQTALAWVLDELERNQEKENHLNTISKMMGTLVHLQLYTFSYRKAVIRPQNMPNGRNSQN